MGINRIEALATRKVRIAVPYPVAAPGANAFVEDARHVGWVDKLAASHFLSDLSADLTDHFFDFARRQFCFYALLTGDLPQVCVGSIDQKPEGLNIDAVCIGPAGDLVQGIQLLNLGLVTGCGFGVVWIAHDEP